MAATSQNVEMEAAKFLDKLIQESTEEPMKLATKLHAILQHMRSSGKENLMPCQIISRAMETLIKSHGLDIISLMSSQQTLTSQTQPGDSSMPQNAVVDLQNDRANELFGENVIPRPMGRNRAKKAARSSVFSDAATFSRGKNSSRMEELIEEVQTYKKTVWEKMLENMDAITRMERYKGAIEATKFIASIEGLNITNPKEKKRVMKLKKKLLEEYSDLIQLSDDEDE